MDALLLYLLKAHGVLVLVAGAYYGLLRQLTFFTLNRFYLLFGVVFAALYPVLPVPALLPPVASEPAALLLAMPVGGPVGEVAGSGPGALDWVTVGLGLYAAGTAVLLLRLAAQLLSVGRLHLVSQTTVINGQKVHTTAGQTSAFSFGRSIYLAPGQHAADELAAILRHEQEHVRQAHTLDVLLVQVLVAAAWCNPAAWLLRRAVLDNLEYLADRAVLQTGLNRRAYQLSLLRLSHAAGASSLVLPFAFSTLKNRVVMMNAPFSSNGHLARYFVAGPLVLAMALGFSAARAQTAAPVTQAAVAATAPRPALQEAYAAAAPATAPAAKQSAAPAAKPRPKTRAGQPISGVASQKAAPAQSTPSMLTQTAAPKPLYYVDGKAFTSDINTLNPKEIASLYVLKGDQARQAFGDGGANGVVIITTKANQDQASVRAFNEKVGASAPAEAEKTNKVAYLAAPALAYIVKNYPDARLISVSEVAGTEAGKPQYKALIAVGRRPAYLLFDGQGHFISELPYSAETR